MSSQPWDNTPGIDVRERHHFLNPAYVTVVETVVRGAGARVVDGEVALQAALTSGILNDFMQGILADNPSGFLASTFLGAIPSVLNTVRDTVAERLQQFEGVFGVDMMSALRAATFLWARPTECGDYSMKTGGCTAFTTLGNTVFKKGVDLQMNGEEYQGFEVGTDYNLQIEGCDNSILQEI